MLVQRHLRASQIARLSSKDWGCGLDGRGLRWKAGARGCRFLQLWCGCWASWSVFVQGVLRRECGIQVLSGKDGLGQKSELMASA